MSEESQPARMPIYIDPVDRTLMDTVSESHQPNEWHPMNGSTTRLFKCLEALKDIEEILETYNVVRNATKRRRRLKSIFVPLHSLCVGIVDLINQIQSDQQMHGRFPPLATQQLTTLRTRFISLVPFAREGKLGKLRNKLSAHYEKGMSPNEMRELYLNTTPTEIGEWIHLALSVLCDLIKLDAYSWTADGPNDNTTIIMCQEPILTVLRIENGEAVSIEGCYLRKVSPKALFFEHIREVTSLSQTLFEKPSKFRIDGFFEDSKSDWARTLTTTANII